MARAPVAALDAIAVNAVLFAVRQAADVICDRASLTLIVAALLGDRRFSDFVRRTGLPTRVVTARLRTLESLGILVRMPYSLRPLRHEYALSVMGRDFNSIILQLVCWERKWAPGGRIGLVHVSCGASLETLVRCTCCGKCATARDMNLKVSVAQLRKMPAKQTLHRRSARPPGQSKSEEQFLGQSLDIVGDKWSVEVAMCAFFRIRRFTDFRKAMGIAPNILADRLERLVALGLFRKVPASPGAASLEYRLTDKGVDLFGVLIALQDWADAWVSARTPSPVKIIHEACGKVFHAATACVACGNLIGDVADVGFAGTEFLRTT